MRGRCVKLFAYARYSSPKQDEGYSIEAQVDAITRWAEANGHQIERVFVDKARSAFKRAAGRRTAFEQMIDAVIAGEAEGVVVHKLDRFSRNQEDGVVYSAMLRRAGKRLFSVSEPMVGGDSPTDRLTEGMLRVLNEFYSLTLATETAKGTRAMAKRGLFPGKVPLGYVRAEDGSKMIVPQEPYATMVRTAFDEMATGRWTLTTWAAEARARGYRSVGGAVISRARWGDTFRRRLYIGEIEWRGEVFPGAHEPLVTREVFGAVQELLDERSRGRKRTRHFYLLRGLVWSAVYDAPMSGNTVKNRHGQVFRYYRALGDGREHNARCTVVEDGVAGLLDNVGGHLGGAVDLNNPLSFLSVAANVGVVYRRLADDTQRRSLLRLVFARGGVGVRADGSVFMRQLNEGFTAIGGDSDD